jgi:hypothetical protein
MARLYHGKWVALKADRKTVIAAGTSLRAALQIARRKGYTHPLLTRMPEVFSGFVAS